MKNTLKTGGWNFQSERENIKWAVSGKRTLPAKLLPHIQENLFHRLWLHDVPFSVRKTVQNKELLRDLAGGHVLESVKEVLYGLFLYLYALILATLLKTFLVLRKRAHHGAGLQICQFQIHSLALLPFGMPFYRQQESGI